MAKGRQTRGANDGRKQTAAGRAGRRRPRRRQVGGFTVDLKPAREALKNLRDELLDNEEKARDPEEFNTVLDAVISALRILVCQDQNMTRAF